MGQLIERMRRSGVVREAGKQSSSGGRPATAWELCPRAWMSATLAIELDSLTWALYDVFGNRIEGGTESAGTDPLEEALDLSVRLGDRAARLGDRAAGQAAGSGGGRCALAVGVPGAVKDGKVLTGDFLEAWADKDLGSLFNERSGLETIVENDLNAIALGYIRYAEANGRKLESLAYIHFIKGSCIGSGLVVDGHVLRGASCFAGELGFLPMYDGRILEDVMYSAETKSGDYAEAVVVALRAVNCVVNPALIVLGGKGFRFDLEDEISARFRSLVDARVRPSLAFSRESSGYYMDGLAGLAAQIALAADR